MRSRTLALSLILFSLLIMPVSGFAYTSNICKGFSSCTSNEVGPFMGGISVACGNSGDCTLGDIMLVFANVGNWILGVIGGVVLLMYVVGGIYLLSSGGNPGRITKGKDYLKKSTLGLLIVFFAYAGINTLTTTLKTPSPDEPPVPPSACDQKQFVGHSCGPSKICVWQDTQTEGSYGTCMDACPATFGVNSGCFAFSEEALELGSGNYETCVVGLCPGDSLCCYTKN